ncbi:transglutaminase domain-containing protein [Aureibaculum luteum]|uniref:transglutaminase domain-containing protein n=1 Tax=Aureibaculum luteum TaxID=1548456 RepID=UPI000E4FD70C|nr:transglutaminase domain-containing protein [Aureibaculum luteum]
MKKLIITALVMLLSLPIIAQDTKLGKATKEELTEKLYPLDSSANAAILFKKRRSHIEYSQGEGFYLVTDIHERIKIYNKDGYDWATKSISLYQGSDDEKVSIKANTFNLTNGKIEKTKLSNKDIFVENVNKYWKRSKFTMPNLTEGCIVEWDYTITSPYYSRIDDMELQSFIPIKYIESKVETPEYFVFKNVMKGYYPVDLVRDSKRSSITFNNKERNGNGAASFSQSKVDYQTNIIECTLKNVPPLKEEPYVNNINNYITALKFELTSTQFPNSQMKFYNTTWEDVTKTIYESSNFGGQLDKKSYFKDDLAALINLTAPENEKINKIFAFVKSKIKWNDFTSKYTNDGVRKAYKEGVGNVAEINLTLVAMLREANLKANPVLISTRDHGIPFFPTQEGFNYVIAGVETSNGIVLLDATEKYSTPNVLPLRDLNWNGRLVREDGSSNEVSLFPIEEAKEMVYVMAEIDDEGILIGTERSSYNNLLALKTRANQNNTSENDLIAKFEKDNDNIEISEFKANNKNDIYKPISYQFDFESDNQVEIIGDKIYFTPLFFHTEKENPFKLDVRQFPIDFGTPFQEKFNITLKLPEGYKVESMPESIAYSTPEDNGSYTFLCKITGNNLQISSVLHMKTSIIASQNYGAIKEFYKQMISKQSEKVVLSKI